MVDLVLWGAGGHGKVVLEVARAMGGFGAISFFDDAFRGGEVFEAGRYLESLNGVRPHFVVSIGRNEMRAACFQRALDSGLLPVTLVHPSAVISPSAGLEEGTVVMARAVINAGACIGRNCIVNTAAVVEHDCRIGDHVHLSPGVLLGGGVTVRSFALVGIGAIVLPGAEIGEGAIVGAGAVVLDTVAAGATVAGTPAKPLVRSGSQSE
jgi:sugar O-acyltransferase (sialic acid O-acetyltransferase NeuD family)